MSKYNIKSVLTGLEKSEKSKHCHWHKPPQDYGPDNPEFSEYNRNSLTDPGDLSMISFTEEFAFGDSSSEESDGNDQDGEAEEGPFDDALPATIVTSATKEWMDPAEETQEENTIEPLQIAERAHYQNMLLLQIEEMSLEDEYKKMSKLKTEKHYQNYMKALNEIKENHETRLQKYYEERDERLALEELRLRQMEEDATQKRRQNESEYIQYVRQKSSELHKLVEDAERREVEQKNIIQGLINELYTMKVSYAEKLEQVKQLLRDLNGEQMLDPAVETGLNNVLAEVDGVLASATKDSVAKNKLTDTKNNLQKNGICLDSIIQALNVRKEEKYQREMERANQQSEQAKRSEEAAKQRAEQEKQEAARQLERAQSQAVETSAEDHQMAMLMNRNRLKHEELKKKMNDNLNAQSKMDNERKKDMGRLITIINQLDGANHNINRERLLTLLGFLGGRNVQHNNKRYCTNNDPVIVSYVKNKLMSNIVKIGHDAYAKKNEDTTCVAAYAWLVVSLVAVYPDMWEIFLYHMYGTCPYLVPLYVFKEEGQSDEDYDKARGMRQTEKEDAFVSRMGKASLLFGLVLSKMSKRTGMPEEAPIVGWKILAGLLMLPPIPGVSATVFEQLLNGVGADLQQTYGKQFAKLMNYVINSYLPRIEEVTAESAVGQQDLNQLKLFLSEYKRTGKIKPNEHINKFN